jgi:hypothetical protein
MERAVAPPCSSLDGETARQPPDERGQKSPGVCGREPDHQIAVPLHGTALIKKKTRIFADEKTREQSPAAEMSQPPDWPRGQGARLPTEYRNTSLQQRLHGYSMIVTNGTFSLGSSSLFANRFWLDFCSVLARFWLTAIR